MLAVARQEADRSPSAVCGPKLEKLFLRTALLVPYTVRYHAEACVKGGPALAFACALDAEARCWIARVVVRLAVNSRSMSENA